MKCGYSENEVALYVESDLPPAQAGEFYAHLKTCASCRELAAALSESQAALKSLRQDVVSPAVLSAMRTRVLAEIGEQSMRWGWGRWVYAIAGAFMVLVLGVGIASYVRQPRIKQAGVSDPLPASPAVPLRKGDTETEPPAAVRNPLGQSANQPPAGRNLLSQLKPPAAPVSSLPLTKGDSRGAKRPAGGRSHRTVKPEHLDQAVSSSEPPKPLMVKLLTDDPNVVIYWLVDQKNGGTL